MPNWIKTQNKAGDTGEIYIYGPITDEKWLTEDVTPTWFKDELARVKGSKAINMFINSPGGGVFAGLTIYNMLKRFTAPINAYIDGLAASISTVIAMAANKISIPKNAMMMIHNPEALCMGGASDMRQTAELLDRCKKSIMNTYSEKTKKPEDELGKLMDAETWFTGQEAVDAGFADEAVGSVDLQACISDKKITVKGIEMNIDNFKRFPVDYIKRQEETNRRIKDFETRHKKLIISYNL